MERIVSCAQCSTEFTWVKPNMGRGGGRGPKYCSEQCRRVVTRRKGRESRQRLGAPASCIDCSQPCYGTRCWACSNSAKCLGPVPQKRLCACGALRSAKAKQCMSCWHLKIRRPGRRRKRVWVPYISEVSLSSQRWRRLREQVIAEEPDCRIGIPGTCTGVSDTADHIVPRSIRPDLMFVRSNLRGACHACNSKLGNGGIARRRLRIYPECLAIEGLGRRQCTACGELFTPRHAMHKYCGFHCREAAKRGVATVREFPRECPICESLFAAASASRKYCSDECQLEANARQNRDRYRAKQGMLVDPSMPTKSYGRRRLWQDEDRHLKTPANAAA